VIFTGYFGVAVVVGDLAVEVGDEVWEAVPMHPLPATAKSITLISKRPRKALRRLTFTTFVPLILDLVIQNSRERGNF
jgi:hypothetical protein